MYIDGVSQGSSTTNYSAPTLASNYDIGRYYFSGAGYEWDGKIDEVHIANKVRTEAWIDTEYNNQNSPSTFYSVGATVDGVNDDGNPKIALTYPNNRQDRFPLRANLQINFNENVQAGSGIIVIYESNGSSFETIAIGSTTISGANVMINPTSNFASATTYYVLIDSGAIEDTSSNAFVGISDDEAWRFTTEGSTGTITKPANIFMFEN